MKTMDLFCSNNEEHIPYMPQIHVRVMNVTVNKFTIYHTDDSVFKNSNDF